MTDATLAYDMGYKHGRRSAEWGAMAVAEAKQILDQEERRRVACLEARMREVTARAKFDITPCPFDWCDEADGHSWGHEVLDDTRSSRDHQYQIVNEDGRPVGIAASVFEHYDLDGHHVIDKPVVEITEFELESPEDVVRFLGWVERAARIVFGEVTR